jgi:hypothetical protein
MLNVEYNPAIPFLSTGLVNEGHHSDAQSFRYTILVCCGRRRTYAHVHFRDADGIGWFLRFMIWRRPEIASQSEGNQARDEPECEAPSTWGGPRQTPPASDR